MVKCSTLIMAGVMFTGGLLLGLILHLPGASSPHSRPIRSIHHTEPSDLQETLNYDAHKQSAILDNHQNNQLPVIGARSLLSKISPQDDINGHQYAEQKASHLQLRKRNNNHHSRRRTRKRLTESSELANTQDISLKGKPGINGYTYYKQGLQHSNQNNKHRAESIENVAQVSITKSHHNKNINISSSYGNEKVLYKYQMKQSDNSNADVRNKAKGKFIRLENEDEIELKNTLPEATKHASADVSDKLGNLQHVEMSVSVIDVAKGSNGGDFKSASDVIKHDRQAMVDVNLESQHATPSNKSLHGHFTQLSEIVDSIYWSPQLERLTPKGFSEIQTTKWRQHAHSSKVKELKEGCGRMQNRLVVFNDGSKMCARYRINTDQIQGEVYSYYLAKTLGIDNVLPPILTTADPAESQWSSVSGAIDSAQWNSRKVFVMTPWLEDLQHAYIPEEFHSNKKHPQKLSPRSTSLVNKTLDELTELVQWSDLVVLDYLTGNVDRVVNNMFNMQWNSGMMQAPTHNLERVGEAGPLVFLDNESGLLHSYRLLEKYNQYHEHLLRTLCVFRKSTAETVKYLFHKGDITQKLKALFKASEPLSSNLAFIPQNNLSVLSQRLAQVYRQIISCERHYAKKT